MPSRSSMMAPAPALLQRHHNLLQGPRPAPLKVSSSTTTAGRGKHAAAEDLVVKRKRRPHHQALRHHQPVIIYVESPKVVHALPGEFKSVVQRLTGAPAAPSSSSSTMIFSAASTHLPPSPLQQFPFQLYGGQGQQLLGLAGVGSDRATFPLPPLVAATGSLSPTIATVADASRSLGYLFGNDQMSMTVSAADPGAIQQPNLINLLLPSTNSISSSNPLLVVPPSSYQYHHHRGGNLFVNQ